MPAKAVVLYSGGLDSLLAAKILIDEGIETTGFMCLLPFVQPDIDPASLKASELAKQINLPLVYHRCGDEYIDMLKNPKHGYGKRANPCIDCKIYFIKKAAEYMRDTGADFVATGEVAGQRPMSQLKHMLNHIAKETGLEGRLLRPLSAKLLKPTAPEEQGLVSRDALFAINGRGRHLQLDLAEKFGIEEYSSPAGGCLFTDTFIAERVRDLLDNMPDFNSTDLYLLTIGRHFRLNKGLKFIVARNDIENNELEKYRGQADYFFIPDFKGPVAFVRGEASEDDLNFIASASARYGKFISEGAVEVYQKDALHGKISVTQKAPDEKLNQIRI